MTESELRPAIFGEAQVMNSDFRTWTDTTGKFSIEAKLIEVDLSDVVLETRDGSTKRVPVEKLSKQDRRFIGK